MKTDNNPKNTRRIKNPSHGEWIYILLCANSLCQKTHPVCPQASCTEEPAFSTVFPFHFQSALPALCLETPQTGVSKTCKKSSFYHLKKQKIHQQRILHLIEEKLYDRRLCFKLKIDQQRISHLTKRKSFMTGDPETKNAPPELFSTKKNPNIEEPSV